MDLQNSTLDDISAVIGFSATLRLSAWLGDLNNLYVPAEVSEEHFLVKLIGMSAAKALSEEWGGQSLAIPFAKAYEVDVRRRMICRMLEQGFNTRETAKILQVTERRVQQVQCELEMAGLLDPTSVVKKARAKPESVLPGESL